MTVTEQRPPGAVRVLLHIRLGRLEGTFERVVALMFRRRAKIVELHLTRDADMWRLAIETELGAERCAHVIAALGREPFVLAVEREPVGEGRR